MVLEMASNGVYGIIIPSCTTIYGSFVLRFRNINKFKPFELRENNTEIYGSFVLRFRNINKFKPFELRENNTEIIRGIRRKTHVSRLLKDLGNYNC